jgi:hypothetical protein
MSSKKLTFSINYSSSFFYRTVCTKCGGGPSLYSSWREVKKSPDTAYSDYKNDWQSFIEWFSLLMRDHYLFCEPKKITKMHAFNEGVEYAFCSCRKTIWVFAERYCNKPESINRRSRYSKALKSMRRF